MTLVHGALQCGQPRAEPFDLLDAQWCQKSERVPDLGERSAPSFTRRGVGFQHLLEQCPGARQISRYGRAHVLERVKLGAQAIEVRLQVDHRRLEGAERIPFNLASQGVECARNVAEFSIKRYA
jgi:hypothetical protein